jgi:cytochrome c oxidase subunit 4
MASSTEITHAKEHHHAGVSPVRVFIILFVATAIEVALTIFKANPATSIPILLALSFVKASLVALYYMHLRYEKPIYGIAFIAPSLFAIFLIGMLSIA